MNDELSREDENAEALNAAVRSETSPDEQILWTGRPDTDAMALPLLPFPICWLSGLFLFSVGVLRNTTDDAMRILTGMIFLLVVVALMGVIEIIAVPWQARRAIYAITDRRILILKLRGKFGYAGMNDYSLVTRRLVRPEKNTMTSYFMYTIPIHLIFAYLVIDLAVSVVTSMDGFVVGGMSLIVFGWIYQWHADMRYPLPQLRECPRAFYFINEWLATVEEVQFDTVKKTILRTRKSGLGDIFVIAKGRGCMRLKSVPDAAKAHEILKQQL